MSRRGKRHARRKLEREITCRLIGHQWVSTGTIDACTRCGISSHEFYTRNMTKGKGYTRVTHPGSIPITHAISYPELTNQQLADMYSKISSVESTISLDTETSKPYSEYVSKRAGKGEAKGAEGAEC